MKAATKKKTKAVTPGNATILSIIRETCPILNMDSFLQEDVCVFRPIIDDLPVGVVIVNPEGKFAIFNREAERMLGMGARDITAEAWSESYGCFLPDKTTPYPSQDLPLARAVRGEEVTDEVIFVRNRHQHEGVWIRTSSRPLKHIGGEHGWAAVVFTDITKQRKMMEDVMMLSRAVEQTADTVLITDRNGIIQYVNPAFEATTGYSREDALGATPRILKSGAHGEDFYRGLWGNLLKGNAFRGTLINRKKTGERYWAEQTITPVREPHGAITHFVAVMKDITESRRQHEQEFQLQLAREVQQRFYAAKAAVPGLDIGVAVYPTEQTGGDYVDLVPGPDNTLGVAIGDVNGHGFDAALVMALTRAYVRSSCAQGLGVGKVLHAVNRMLVADLEDNRYVTLLLVHIDLPDSMLTYASAGHVPGFILDGEGEIECVLESTGMPLGLFIGHRIGTKLVKLHPGQLIVLLTDGVTEAGNPEEEQFGAERAIAYVRAHRKEPAQLIAEGLYRVVREFADNQPQSDDEAVVILKME